MLHHVFKDIQVPQMDSDETIGNRQIPKGWVNATKMCRPYNEQFSHYSQLAKTKAFVEALSADTGFPVSQLVITIRGGGYEQGSWVHPQIAIDLASWLSPEFKVWATGTLMKIMYGVAEAQSNPELPARVVALETAHAIAEIQQTLSDFDPRIAQILIDHAMRDIADTKTLASADPELPAMAGVVEIAGDLGYKVSKEESVLGRHVATQWRKATNTDPQESRRECGGAFRKIKVYPRDSQIVIDAIKEFYDTRKTD